ncbi:MAG: MurR/RpiR family transcriptional regulator [Oscillospiraceae bacterium]|nr:MurR/RpiR family transcriptional regulator [Oscillospiraceae bacterium]MDD7430089.1 MurR/RpiR family transcriptional regulator [Oscillospiraceae bacterium]MDY2847046.1 MurR/RpiR family transcriptional regulator [Oscillospiraceae bacterium]
MPNEIIGKLNEIIPTLSKGHKKIAEYIIGHYDKAAFMTASKLGAIVGVSESTVVRFATELGYEGYPELQKALKEFTSNKLTTVQRMDVMTDQLAGEDVLSKVMNFDIDQIRHTLDSLDKDEFYRTIDALCEAKSIYVIGARSASVLARFIVFYFNVMFENVKIIHTTSTSEMFEQILNIGEHDIMIGVSFPRYSKHTVKAFRYAKENGAKVIAITDSPMSPIAENADYLLLARSDMASFADSLVAPMSLINALITAVSMRKKDYVSANYERLERIWDEYEVYEKSDDQDYSK